MLHLALSDEKFCDIMHEHIQDVIKYLLSKGVNFSVLVNLAEINFQPPLPDEIMSTFKPITMFMLAGYTFESAIIDEDIVSFEAGFGTNNFGSLVGIPILAILQIIVEETPVFINLSIPSSQREAKKQKNGLRKSMDALLSNPENKKLLKK